MAQRLRPINEKWEEYKEDILSLYRKNTLPCVIQLMHQKHGFRASKNQYTRMLRAWGVRKNCNGSIWKIVDARIRKRKLAGKTSDVYLNGNHVPPKKVQKEIARHVGLTNMYYEQDDVSTPDGLAILSPSDTMNTSPLCWDIRVDNLPWVLFNGQIQSQTKLLDVLYGAEYSSSVSTTSTTEESFDVFDYSTSYSELHNFEAVYTSQDTISDTCQPNTLDLDKRTMNWQVPFEPLPNYWLLPGSLDYSVDVCSEMQASSSFSRPITHEFQSAFLSVLLHHEPDKNFSTISLEPFYELYVVEEKCLTTSSPDNKLSYTDNPTLYQIFNLFMLMVTNNVLDQEAIETIFAWTITNCCRIFTEILDLRLATIDVFATKLLPAAVRVGDVELVQRLISRNVDIDTPIQRTFDGKFRTALSLAVGRRNLQMIEVLCGLGAAPEIMRQDVTTIVGSRDSLWSPRHIGMLRTLLQYGADPDCLVLDEPRGYPLTSAASEGYLETVLLLLATGADMNIGVPNKFGTALQSAVVHGHIKIVRALIEAGADVNMPCTAGPLFGYYLPVYHEYNPLKTPIQLAAEANNTEVVQLLLHSGALVNACPAVAHFGLQMIEETLSLHCEPYRSVDRMPFAFAIQYAARNGNILLVRQLITAGANVNSRIGTTYGDTPLQLAARMGNVDLALLLLKHNSNVNDPPGKYNGRTALQGAAESGNTELIQILLDAGADINAPAGFKLGRTAIQTALEKGHIDAARRLLCANADINSEPAFHGGLTALQAAVDFGDIVIVKEILSYGADVNAAAGPEKGVTALQAAVRRKCIQLLEYILQAGADVDAVPSMGTNRTALQYAVSKDWLEGAKLILKYDPEVRGLPPHEDIFAFSALGWAIKNKNHDMMVLLFEHGANPNDPVLNDRDRPPMAFLYALSWLSDPESIEVFVERGADISQYWNGRSALEVAVGSPHVNVVIVKILIDLFSKTSGDRLSNAVRNALTGISIDDESPAYIALIKLLLDAGADINAKGGDNGTTMLQKSVSQGRSEVVEFLLRNGAEVNIPANRKRGTPLQEAILFEAAEIANVLIEHGADVNAPPAEEGGVTALQAAAIHGYNQLALKLLKLGANVTAAPSPIFGRTAIDGAAEHGRLDMLQLLLNAYGEREELTSVCGRAACFAEKEGHAAIAVWLRTYSSAA